MRIVNLIENTEGAAGCTAAHGLSFYIETARHKLLVDLGPSEETLKNAERLGIDMTCVDTVFFTGHCTGIPAYERMKAVMGDRLRYVHSGDEVRP